MGTLEVDVWTGAAWVNILSVSGQQQTAGGDAWLDFASTLPALSSSLIQFRFIGIRGGGFASDMSIDDIFVIEEPACAPPLGLSASNVTSNSADISWLPGGGSSTRLEFGPSGFTPGSGTGINGVSSPYSLMGLSPLTSYDVYLVDDCGSALSALAGPLSFTTLPAPPPLPVPLNCTTGNPSVIFS